MPRLGTKEKSNRLQIPIPNGPRLGNKVLEVNGLQKSYGEKLLIDDLTFKLPPAGIVAWAAMDRPAPHSAS